MASNELARLASAITRHTTAASLDGTYDTAVPGLLLCRLPAPWDYPAVVYEPGLYVVAQGAKEVILDGQAYRYDSAQSLLVSVDLPVSARVVTASSSRPCLLARVSLDPTVVGELLADGIAAPPGPPVRALALSPAAPPLLDAVGRLVALLDSPKDVQALGPLVLREITYRVLTGPHGARLCQVASAGAPAQRVLKAIRYLRKHFAQPLSVEVLARNVRMSPSAFHAHFKCVTGLSPLQYQKRLRLQEARRLLVGERRDAAEAAFQVGYESPCQFSREYRRMFGSPPRRDVAALQAGTDET